MNLSCLIMLLVLISNQTVFAFGPFYIGRNILEIFKSLPKLASIWLDRDWIKFKDQFEKSFYFLDEIDR